MINRYPISNIKISVINISATISFLSKSIKNKHLSYVCVTNARTTYLANNDLEYCNIQNNSLLTVPDGAPLIWIAHNQGFKGVDKVSGKDLMDAIFDISVEKDYSHYFYGSTPQTISQLQNNIKENVLGIDIKGAISPPFQPLEKFDIDSLANEINSLKPTFFGVDWELQNKNDLLRYYNQNWIIQFVLVLV